MSRIWAGIDSGKGHHHGLVLDADGRILFSRRVANDEPELLKLIGDVLDLADGREVTWAIDMTGGELALLLALSAMPEPWPRSRSRPPNASTPPGEKTIAKLVHTLAEEEVALNEQIRELDKLIEGRFREHELADILLSVPGIGTVLGAEFLAAVRGSLDEFDSPDALAAFRWRRPSTA